MEQYGEKCRITWNYCLGHIQVNLEQIFSEILCLRSLKPLYKFFGDKSFVFNTKTQKRKKNRFQQYNTNTYQQQQQLREAKVIRRKNKDNQSASIRNDES